MFDDLNSLAKQAVNSGVSVRLSINTDDVRNIILTAAATVVVTTLLIVLIVKKIKS